jgi:hypothetical protein
MISSMLVQGPGEGSRAGSLGLRIARRLAPGWVTRKQNEAFAKAAVDYAGKLEDRQAATDREDVSQNPLFSIFDSNAEGPGAWKPRQYFKVYHRHLARFVGRAVNVVEVGVYSGGSLRMWREYFGPRATIHGIDIDPACRQFESDRIEIVIGDQSDRGFWREFLERVPQIDIVIDDGSHVPEHQVATLEALLPHISNGGVYICEDIGGADNPFHSYLAGLARPLSSLDAESSSEGQATTGVQQQIEGIHIYPYIAVIEKPEKPFARFSTEVRGTEWIDDRTGRSRDVTSEAPAGGVNGAADS